MISGAGRSRNRNGDSVDDVLGGARICCATSARCRLPAFSALHNLPTSASPQSQQGTHSDGNTSSIACACKVHALVIVSLFAQDALHRWRRRLAPGQHMQSHQRSAIPPRPRPQGRAWAQTPTLTAPYLSFRPVARPHPSTCAAEPIRLLGVVYVASGRGGRRGSGASAALAREGVYGTASLPGVRDSRCHGRPAVTRLQERRKVTYILPRQHDARHTARTLRMRECNREWTNQQRENSTPHTCVHLDLNQV
jgi:hypothetical protein